MQQEEEVTPVRSRGGTRARPQQQEPRGQSRRGSAAGWSEGHAEVQRGPQKALHTHTQDRGALGSRSPLPPRPGCRGTCFGYLGDPPPVAAGAALTGLGWH